MEINASAEMIISTHYPTEKSGGKTPVNQTGVDNNGQ